MVLHRFDKIPTDDDKYKKLVGLLFQDIQFQIDPSSYYQSSSDSKIRIGSLVRTGTELLIIVDSRQPHCKTRSKCCKTISKNWERRRSVFLNGKSYLTTGQVTMS